MKRVTKRALALSLHAAGRTVEEIARTLEVVPEIVGDWLEIPAADDMYAGAVTQTDYARNFRGVLRFRDVEAARDSVAKIDALYRGFVESGDLRGVHQAQLMALIGKNRAEGIGKETCARLFGEWLAAHLWTPAGGDRTSESI